MDSKTSFFLVGLLVVGVIMVSLILIFTRPASLPVPEGDEKIFSANDLTEIKSQTGGLQNYGNLPNALSADEVGRENPFDSYK